MAAEASCTFLGTGTSVGVPVIGCSCSVCTSFDPRNRRLRSSILIQSGPTTVLVDSGPDLRAQALREGFTKVDAVLYTHEHLDHVSGFDELRAFCWHKEGPLPLYGSLGCLTTLRRMYPWAFALDNHHRGYIKPLPILVDGPFAVGALEVRPLPVEHASVETLGYLFAGEGLRSLAYLPDVKRIPAETFEWLRGVDVLVLDALRPAGHPTHLSTSEALDLIASLEPGEAWFTHLGHENDHAALEKTLPPSVRVAHDGLRIELGKSV